MTDRMRACRMMVLGGGCPFAAGIGVRVHSANVLGVLFLIRLQVDTTNSVEVNPARGGKC